MIPASARSFIRGGVLDAPLALMARNAVVMKMLEQGTDAPRRTEGRTMPLLMDCPICQTRMSVADELPPGSRVACPGCRTVLATPSPLAGPPPAMPPPEEFADEPPAAERRNATEGGWHAAATGIFLLRCSVVVSFLQIGAVAVLVIVSMFSGGPSNRFATDNFPVGPERPTKLTWKMPETDFPSAHAGIWLGLLALVLATAGLGFLCAFKQADARDHVIASLVLHTVALIFCLVSGLIFVSDEAVEAISALLPWLLVIAPVAWLAGVCLVAAALRTAGIRLRDERLRQQSAGFLRVFVPVILGSLAAAFLFRNVIGPPNKTEVEMIANGSPVFMYDKSPAQYHSRVRITVLACGLIFAAIMVGYGRILRSGQRAVRASLRDKNLDLYDGIAR
jgi:hypothetical protein